MFRLVWIGNKVAYTLEFADYDTCVSFAVTNLSVFAYLWIIYDVHNNLVYLGDTYGYNRRTARSVIYSCLVDSSLYHKFDLYLNWLNRLLSGG